MALKYPPAKAKLRKTPFSPVTPEIPVAPVIPIIPLIVEEHIAEPNLKPDGFCWHCRTSINSDTDFKCRSCYRSFHYNATCGVSMKRIPLFYPKHLQNFIPNPSKPICIVCEHLHRCASTYIESELPQLNQAILLAIDRLLQFDEDQNEEKYFSSPVDTRSLPTYREYVVNPMDLSRMRQKAIHNKYKSPVEFWYDVQMVIIYFLAKC